jgi:hypothetical protein
MRRTGVAALVLAGLAVSPAAAASARWSAQGTVTALSVRSITVHGKTCRISPAASLRHALTQLGIGADAKIRCTSGVLKRVAVVKPTVVTLPPPSVAVVPNPTPVFPGPGPATRSGGGPPGTA